MEKFSLYELLSFIAPGFLAIYLTNLYCCQVFGIELIKNISDINVFESILYLILALVIGIILHIITFSLIKIKCYKNLVYRDLTKIVKLNGIAQIYPFLTQIYCEINKPETQGEKQMCEEVFDSAYYFLEVHDKIGQAKNFQSLYFFFRNILTVALFAFVAFLISTIIGYFTVNNFNFCLSCCFTAAMVLIFAVFVYPAIWLREKMMIRLFRSYYTYIVHAKNNLNP